MPLRINYSNLVTKLLTITNGVIQLDQGVYLG